MKNPVIAACVFLLAALGLVAALTLSARTDSGSMENTPQNGNASGPETNSNNAAPAVKPPVVSDDPRFKGMVWIPTGKFLMGEVDTVPDEFPPHEVELDGFWMDTTEVTNAEFKAFVDVTGYVTTAERAPELRSIKPGSGLENVEILPEFNKPGSICSLQLASR